MQNLGCTAARAAWRPPVGLDWAQCGPLAPRKAGRACSCAAPRDGRVALLGSPRQAKTGRARWLHKSSGCIHVARVASDSPRPVSRAGGKIGLWPLVQTHQPLGCVANTTDASEPRSPMARASSVPSSPRVLLRRASQRRRENACGVLVLARPATRLPRCPSVSSDRRGVSKSLRRITCLH